MRKGMLMGGGFIWIVAVILAVFWLSNWVPFNLMETVGSSPISFMTPSFDFLQNISQQEYSLPVGFLALMVIFVVFIKK